MTANDTFDLVARAFEARQAALRDALTSGGRLPIEALRSSARVLSRSPSGVMQLAVAADTSALEEKDCGVVVDERRMSASFPISTPRKDRMGDVVVPRGCLPHIKNFERNPRVFFAHKSDDFSIGSARDPETGALTLDVGDSLIRSTCFFHGETAESECVFRLVKRKELQATSIGFLPVVASLISDEDDEDSPKKTKDGERIVKFGGFLPLRFLEWDLTEWSVVPVPANPDACESLSATLSRGHVEGERLPLSLRRALEPFKLKGRVWSQGFNPETTGYTGTLAVGERELEYAEGKLTRIDDFKLLKDDPAVEVPGLPAEGAASATPGVGADSNVFVLTAESLTTIVEKAVGSALAVHARSLKDMSALDDTAGGALNGAKDDDKALQASVDKLAADLKAHVEEDAREHKEILAAIADLKGACDAERSLAKANEARRVEAVKGAADAALAGLAATNDLALRRLERLTGRR